MIKIIHVVSALDSGGVEAMLLNYYEKIDKNKIKFDFIVHDKNIGMLEKKFEKLGSTIFHVTPKKESFFKNFKEIKMIIQQGDYDIVHSHQNLSSFVPLIISKFLGIKIRITHSHVGFNNELFLLKIKNFPLKILIKVFSTNLFACSELAGKWLFGNTERRNFSLVNNAININKFTFNNLVRSKIRRKYEWNNNFVIGNVARFTPEKNHDKLLLIFEQVKKVKPSAVLVLIGTGKQEESIKSKVLNMNLQASVFFLGGRKDVHQLLQAMDVFLLPSEFEGLGMAFIEAQAAGLRCFSSDMVPKETQVTNLIEYISLTESPKFWADRILSVEDNYKREDKSKYIKESGFDIESEARYLNEFYLNMYEKSYRK